MRSLVAAATPVVTAPAPRRRRAAAWLALVCAVLVLHAWVWLAMLPGSTQPSAAAPAPRPAALKLVARVPAAAMAPAPPLAAPIAAPGARAATGLPGERSRRAPAAPAARADSAAAPVVLPALAIDAGAATGASASADADIAFAVAQASQAAGEAPVPVYATRLPASARLHYQLQRGGVVGSGQLLWQRQAESYEISLEGELQGLPVLSTVSRGLIDADGVAPLRLADRRRARELRAANFQREARRISFSGPQVEYPLQAGAQDRLSWMIQLPAIIEADPALARPGARVLLFVVGTRGDAQTWRFDVQGKVPLQVPAGEVAQALHLRREPQRPYDTRVEVWLDPQRQHLPVRAVLTSVPYGQPLELNLSHLAQPGP